MTKLEESTIEHLDEEWEIACENPSHNDDPWDHEGLAEFWVTNMCSGVSRLSCRKFVLNVVVGGDFYCRSGCGEVHPASMLHYEEIKR